MRPPVVVAHILAQQSLGLALVPDEYVIETVAPDGADDSLAMGIRRRRTGRRNEARPARLRGVERLLHRRCPDCARESEAPRDRRSPRPPAGPSTPPSGARSRRSARSCAARALGSRSRKAGGIAGS